MAGESSGLKRELIVLIGLVLAVDAAFVAVFYAAGVRSAGATVRLGFTVAWTLAALAVVLRGLARIRSARLRRRQP